MLKKTTSRIGLILTLLLLALPAFSAEFTLDDLKKMVTELAAIAPENDAYQYPIEVMIDDEDVVNAYATAVKQPEGKPQARMVVYQGLIDFVKGDARIIRAVVSHEIAHLSEGHVKPTQPAARDLSNLWTRQQEMEADRSGAAFLQRCGHSKQDVVDMLLKLEEVRGRGGSWFSRLTGSHPDPKARAAQISDDPRVLNALLSFDVGLAYMDCRRYGSASILFSKAAEQEPELKEAFINAGQAALMSYYDNLPTSVREDWFRPDFGPALVEPSVAPRGDRITDADRARYKIALDKLMLAKEKVGDNQRVNDLLGLAYVLDPDGEETKVLDGIEMIEKLVKDAKDDYNRLRYANNMAVGYQRTGNVQKAYDLMIDAQSKTTKFIPALGENLGRLTVKNQPQNLRKLTADVLYTWLKRTPAANTNWLSIKDNYEAICEVLKLKPADVKPENIYLCKLVSLNLGDEEYTLLSEVDSFRDSLGTPDLTLSFDKRYPDLTEVRWNGGNFAIFTERGSVMRITSYEPGTYALLRPVDRSVAGTIKIEVGMSEEEFNKILKVDSGIKKLLARGGKAEEWLYYPMLNLGVMIEDGEVKGLTVTPVARR